MVGKYRILSPPLVIIIAIQFPYSLFLCASFPEKSVLSSVEHVLPQRADYPVQDTMYAFRTFPTCYFGTNGLFLSATVVNDKSNTAVIKKSRVCLHVPEG